MLLTVAYDGTNYCGWQRQQNGPSIQQTLEEALAVLLARPVKTTASSRTDAGVHALGQCVAFDAPDLKIPPDKLPQVLNSLLPPDIAVQHARPVPPEFHPRFHPRHKTYLYQVLNTIIQNPLQSRYAAHIAQPLHFEAMQAAAHHFIGHHDFAAFCAAGHSAKTTTRYIYHCALTRQDALLSLQITGNAFLYNMVRIIAGTLIYVGLGKIPPDAIPQIIADRDRTKAGKTLPPCGLTLVEVVY